MSLAPFRSLSRSGLLRRPVFVGDDHTVKAVAANAWQWAEEGKAAQLQWHELSYRGFKRDDMKSKELRQDLLPQLLSSTARRSSSLPET